MGVKCISKLLMISKVSKLMSIITGKIVSGSVVYMDSYLSYNTLGVMEFYHHRINYRKEF